MDKWLTIKDLSVHFKIPEATIRSWLKRNLFTVSMQTVDKRRVKCVFLDEKAKEVLADYFNLTMNEINFDAFTMSKNEKKYEPHNDHNDHNVQPEIVQEAEIISNLPNYQIVSMENNTFEQLIQDIKDLANDRATSDKEAYNRLEKEYFELKSKRSQLEEVISQLKDENKELAIHLAQCETNFKIQELKVKELNEIYESEIANLKKEIEELKKKTKWFRKNLF